MEAYCPYCKAEIYEDIWVEWKNNFSHLEFYFLCWNCGKRLGVKVTPTFRVKKSEPTK